MVEEEEALARADFAGPSSSGKSVRGIAKEILMERSLQCRKKIQNFK